MIKRILLFLLLIFMIGHVAAANQNVSVTVDTTVVNSNFLDVDIWVLILVLGIVMMLVSHIPAIEKAAPIWAWLAPFFTVSALWFCNSLQRVYVQSFFNESTGNYNVITEHMVQHLDYFAIGLIGIIFIFSLINCWYVSTRKTIEKPTGRDMNTREDND